VKKLLLAILFAPVLRVVAQQHCSKDSLERRIDFLICKKEYTGLIESIEKDSLVVTGIDIKNHVAQCHYGKPARNHKRPVIFYTIAYDMRSDKIRSVSRSGR
jgi:hypothetical protein